jgi:CBS domain containing-hemolysin-like protein
VPGLFLQLAALFFLLLLSGFFSGAEIALISSNKVRIRRLAGEGNQGALHVSELLQRPNRLLATILIWNNLVNILATAIATGLAIRFFDSRGIGIATGAMTFLILVFGEITPKGYCTKNAVEVSLRIAKPVSWLMRLSSPLVVLITTFTNRLIALLGGEPKISLPFVTEEEIKLLVSIGEEEGTIEKEEKEMIAGVFEFGETVAKEVMIPRIDIDRIEATKTLDEAMGMVLQTGHSRTPVYEGNIDNIIGILFTKDLLRYMKEGKGRMAVKEAMREAIFIPESKPLPELLKEMREKHIQMAIVVDEYGGTEGLITLEDLLEEIVGEILDEYDVEEAGIQRQADGSVRLDARTRIDEVNETFHLSLPSTEFETIGGLVFNTLQKVPVPGDRVTIEGVELIVEKMRGRRISRVKMRIPPAEKEPP